MEKKEKMYLSKRIAKWRQQRLMFGTLILGACILFGCYDDGVCGDNYYVFKGQTIGAFLDANEQYSEFLKLLDLAGMKGLMVSYGDYTCLAPTNDAIEEYIQTNFPQCTLETLPDSVVKAVAKSHIIGQSFLTSDFSTGYLPLSNMYDRKVQVTIKQKYDSITADSVTVYILNSYSQIIQANDTVSNGVVHTINRVLEQSNYVLPDYMASVSKQMNFTLFMAALQITNLADSLLLESDVSEEMTESLAQYALKYTERGQRVPSSRKLGYTVFVEKDEVFQKINDPQNTSKKIFTGVNIEDDLQSLANYAKAIYDVVYPEDAGVYDSDYKNPKNPLNRFIAYHILNRNVGYSELVVSGPYWSVNEGGDNFEYFETMCANTLLRLQMVSSKGNAIYLNRCERDNNIIDGVEVLSSGGLSTVNGNFQFISKILVYDEKVLNMFKTERIRIDTSSLLAELTNNGIRQDSDGEMLGWYFPSGYFKGLYYDDNSICFYNRWPQGKSAGTGNWTDLAAYQTDNLNFNGDFDVTIRIPAVPAGQYEIRLGYACNGLMSIAQIYFGYERQYMIPVGIPLDMNLTGQDAKVGLIRDDQLFDDIHNDVGYNLSGQVTITENDKAMRNLGYMKGPAAMYRVSNDRVSTTAKITNNFWYLRRIVTTQKLENRPFYLRFRKVDERTGRLLNLDFIEICPRNIYNGATPENRY